MFACGAARATVGSLAATDRDTTLDLLEQWGPSGYVGSRLQGRPDSGIRLADDHFPTLHEFTRDFLRAGFKTVISTDIARTACSPVRHQDVPGSGRPHAGGWPFARARGQRRCAVLPILTNWRPQDCGELVGEGLVRGCVTAAGLADWQARQGGSLLANGLFLSGCPERPDGERGEFHQSPGRWRAVELAALYARQGADELTFWISPRPSRTEHFTALSAGSRM